MKVYKICFVIAFFFLCLYIVFPRYELVETQRGAIMCDKIFGYNKRI